MYGSRHDRTAARIVLPMLAPALYLFVSDRNVACSTPVRRKQATHIPGAVRGTEHRHIHPAVAVVIAGHRHIARRSPARSEHGAQIPRGCRWTGNRHIHPTVTVAI